MSRSLFLVGSMLFLMAGCSSMSSTYVGNATPGSKFEGMPVVVQRPKYLKVTYKKATYLPIAKKTETQGGNPTVSVQALASAVSVDEITTEVVSVGEVYTLDLKRPGAGTTDYSIEFDTNAQYPKKVGAKIEDKTLEAVGAMLGMLIEKSASVFKPASATPPEVPAESFRISESVVKIELRSLDDPSVVYQVFP